MKILNFYRYLLIIVIAVEFSVAQTNPPPSIPPHPSMLKYDSLKWSVPMGEQYRTVLKNGLRAYVATDSTLPLVEISGHIRYGGLLDPVGKEGLSTLLGMLLRSGGTAKYPADTVDKIIDQKAMNFSFVSDDDIFNFRVSFLSNFNDTAFDILQQILFNPVFDQKKLDQKKSLLMEGIRHRFDNPGPTMGYAYQKAMYPKTLNSHFVSEQSIKAITRDDLVKMHKKYFLTQNIIFSIAGPFDRSVMINKLETLFPVNGAVADTTFPVIECKPELKSLVAFKSINQAYVRIGIPLFKRPNTDYYPVSVLNQILGGGGFTSRLGTRIRSDEGLTYSIYSNAESNYTFPGTWYIDYFTKSESFPKATRLVFQEVDKLVKDGVTPEELSAAKSMLTEELPSMFRSPFDIVSTYALNEYNGRSPDHYKKYTDEIKKISKENINEVAKKYLQTEKMVITVVGDTTALFHANDSVFDLQKFTPQKVIDATAIPQLP
jgi:zinc protease